RSGPSRCCSRWWRCCSRAGAGAGARRPPRRRRSRPTRPGASSATWPATTSEHDGGGPVTVLAASGSQATGTTVLAAFAVGFVSFISPCVLPLVPGYLSAVSGVTIRELSERHHLRRVLLPSAIFCLSFSVMFVLLGMTATK